MADIYLDFQIEAPRSEVFRAITAPAGLNAWWTLRAEGEPRPGAACVLDFGPGYVWRATVCTCELNRAFEWELVDAVTDWLGTRVGFVPAAGDGITQVRFRHTGSPGTNAHYRQSNYCCGPDRPGSRVRGCRAVRKTPRGLRCERASSPGAW